MDLRPDIGIGDVTEAGEIDPRNKLPARAGEDDDAVLAVPRDAIEGLCIVGVVAGGEGERAAVEWNVATSTPAASRSSARPGESIEIGVDGSWRSSSWARQA